MAETNDGSSTTEMSSTETKTLSLNRPGRLELKTTIDGGKVRQSFPHGRAKQVAVEVKRRRVIRPGRADEGRPEKRRAEDETPAPAPAETARESAARRADARRVATSIDKVQDVRAPVVLRNLTEEEREGRLRALDQSKRAEEEARRRAEEEARRRAEEESRLAAEQAKSERRKLEEDERRRREEEARRKAEEQAERLLEKQRAKDGTEETGAADSQAAVANEAVEIRRGKRDKRSPLAPRTRQDTRRRRGKLTVSQALSVGYDEGRSRSLAAARRAREKLRQQQLGRDPGAAPARVVREVVIPEAMTVQELAGRMAVRGGDVIKKLMEMGQMVTITQTIDADTAELLVAEFGHNARRVLASDVERGLKQDDDADLDKRPRPPIVTVMGHVDHGKTSLLDALRKTDVVSGEAGGITQHIGAYRVQLAGGAQITFLDTPGHAAFTAMRARGANVTDIVVLVIAANDSVMPQTREAIDHAKAAGVPIIVALNKSDLPAADPGRVRQDLLRHDLAVEDMGGDVLDVEISALKGEGLDRLEEAILLQAELLETRANPQRNAEGVVVEGRLDKGRGVVATLLVQRGTLHAGDIVVVGREWGRIRAMTDDRGKALATAGPSTPVEVLGLSGVPIAGDEFGVVDSEKRGREITDYRQRQERGEKFVAAGRASMEQLFANIAAGEATELPVVVKADVQGSAEAIAQALDGTENEGVKPRVLHAAVGAITESDITLAKASEAVVLGFGVRANSQARQLAEREGVKVLYYKVIYELLDDVGDMLRGLLAPATEEKVLGAAQVLQTFDISKVGLVAGCRVVDGIMRRNAMVRLLRDGRVRFEGAMKTLRHHKDEIREIKQGSECGIQLDGWHDIEVGDEIECYLIAEVERAR